MLVSFATQKESLRGPISPVMTPFTKDGEIDRGLYRDEVRFLLDSGVSGISPGGSTGEGAVLTDEELVSLIEIVKEENTAGLPVVAGVIRLSTKAAVRTATVARDSGADVLMVTPPFYNVLVPDDAGNQEFYERVCDVGLPVVIYNVVPQNVILPAAAKKIIEIPNMLGVKQSVGGIQAMYEMRLALEGTGLVYGATDEMLPTCYRLGADGAIAAIVGLFPRLSVKLWDLVQEGSFDAALALQKTVYPLWEIIRGGQFPARMKLAAAATGRNLGHPRSPLLDGSDELRARIEQALTTIVAEIGPLS